MRLFRLASSLLIVLAMGWQTSGCSMRAKQSPTVNDYLTILVGKADDAAKYRAAESLAAQGERAVAPTLQRMRDLVTGSPGRKWLVTSLGLNHTLGAEKALESLLGQRDIAVNAAGALVDRGSAAGRTVLEEAAHSPDADTSRYARDLLEELDSSRGERE